MSSTLALCAYLVAAMTAALAGRCQASPRRRSIWRWVAGVQIACALELVLKFRLHITKLARVILREDGLYEARQYIQVPLTSAAVNVLVFASAFLWTKRRAGLVDAPILTAMVGSLLSIFTFFLEAISLHRLDLVMDEPIGPLLGYGWVWIFSAVVVVSAAGATRAGASE